MQKIPILNNWAQGFLISIKLKEKMFSSSKPFDYIKENPIIFLKFNLILHP